MFKRISEMSDTEKGRWLIGLVVAIAIGVVSILVALRSDASSQDRACCGPSPSTSAPSPLPTTPSSPVETPPTTEPPVNTTSPPTPEPVPDTLIGELPHEAPFDPGPVEIGGEPFDDSVLVNCYYGSTGGKARFQLAGQYRKFVAKLGLPDDWYYGKSPKVYVTAYSDIGGGFKRLTGPIEATESVPRAFEFDVTGVRTLEIRCTTRLIYGFSFSVAVAQGVVRA